MGEKVAAGPFIYTVLETEWKSQLGPDSVPIVPTHRFLVVKLTVSNTTNRTVSIPQLSLMGADAKTYAEEVSAGSEVPQWYGPLLRRVDQERTEPGAVVFDVPYAAYDLKVTDGGEFDQERYALIGIPVNIE